MITQSSSIHEVELPELISFISYLKLYESYMKKCCIDLYMQLNNLKKMKLRGRKALRGLF